MFYTKLAFRIKKFKHKLIYFELILNKMNFAKLISFKINVANMHPTRQLVDLEVKHESTSSCIPTMRTYYNYAFQLLYLFNVLVVYK